MTNVGLVFKLKPRLLSIHLEAKVSLDYIHGVIIKFSLEHLFCQYIQLH